MAYADGFLIPVPTKNLDAYRKLSEKAGAIWMEHGALDYKECAGDDMNIKGMSTSFPKTLVTKKSETVVFAWIVYRDRAHRDAVIKAVMADPRLAMDKEMPFDMKRMLCGGFNVIVDMAPAKAAKKTPAKKAAAKKKAKRANK
ncbi:MAG: DUF1428 domain-containing protein [Hyphomonadaceae bacterium]